MGGTYAKIFHITKNRAGEYCRLCSLGAVCQALMLMRQTAGSLPNTD